METNEIISFKKATFVTLVAKYYGTLPVSMI